MLDRFALWRRLHEHGAFALSVVTFQSSITKETPLPKKDGSPFPEPTCPLGFEKSGVC